MSSTFALLKDYFAILGVKPSADFSEIKQAYRKLAMRYHPDKHKHDPEKTTLYEQIREAYEILTEPARRDEYLQERWRLKAQGIKLDENIISNEIILKRAIALGQRLRFSDPLRISEEKIRQQFNHVLSDEAIRVLNIQQDVELNSMVASVLLDSLNTFPLSVCREQCANIEQIALTDEHIHKRMQELLKKKTTDQYWDKYKFLLVLAVTMLICLLIAYLS